LRHSIAFEEDLSEIESGLEKTRLGPDGKPFDGLIDIFRYLFALQIVDTEVVS
jgi:hypothetical protein